jgi:Fe-Mn family superoxide dismutase
MKLKNILEGEHQFITEFNRPALKYSMNALNKYIDTKTMEEHYGVHFKKYTDSLNEALKDEKIRVGSIHELLRLSANYSKKLSNNVGGYFNHVLYFDQFTPEKKSPEGKLKYLLEREFGDFTSEFTQAGLDLFGSGWVWLVSDGTDNLSIMTTPNQDNPYMASNFGGQILLGMDVWEHAYYLKHQANRKAHIKDFFSVIDWDVVSDRLIITKQLK